LIEHGICSAACFTVRKPAGKVRNHALTHGVANRNKYSAQKWYQNQTDQDYKGRTKLRGVTAAAPSSRSSILKFSLDLMHPL
jgi:hypothetical protein